MKHSNLDFGLVLPSGGWQSLIGGPFSLFGKLLVLPANVRLDWKVFARCKHSSLFDLVVSNEEKKFFLYHWHQGILTEGEGWLHLTSLYFV